jgi:Spy/CpxP family protein refolding chaperone
MSARLMSPTRRAQAIGAALLCLAFAAGVLSGVAWTRTRRDGVNVQVRMTTELPSELRALDLTPAQTDTLRAIFAAGQRQSLRVLRELEPRMRAEMDSVNAEIRAVLTPEQRARFDARRRPIQRDVVERIDTTSR